MNDYIKKLLKMGSENIYDYLQEVREPTGTEEEVAEAREFFCKTNSTLSDTEWVEAWADIHDYYFMEAPPELKEYNMDAFEDVKTFFMSHGFFEPFYNFFDLLKSPIIEDIEDQFALMNWFNDATYYNLKTFLGTWGAWQIVACCEEVRESFGLDAEGKPKTWSYDDFESEEAAADNSSEEIEETAEE